MPGCTSSPPPPPPAIRPEPAGPAFDTEPSVEVLLNRYRDKSTVSLKLEGAYDVYDAVGDRIGFGESIESGRLEIRAGSLVLNGRRLGARIGLRPRQDAGMLVIENRPYPGSLEAGIRSDGTLELAMHVRLESYLEGVVASEMPANYPLEAKRAQAIAARTYAVHQMLAGPPEGSRYVLDDTVYSMAYRGHEWVRPGVVDAVRSTASQVLTYRGRPMKAYFHSTCGGRTASCADAFGDPVIPPLRGGVADPYCPSTKWGRWLGDLDRSDLDRVAGARGMRGKVIGVDIVSKTPEGRAREVRLRTASGERVMSAVDFRLGVGPEKLRSTWWIESAWRGDTFAVEGRGFGHGVGLCQVGSRGMAEAGESAEEILLHFYPDAVLAPCYPPGSSP